MRLNTLAASTLSNVRRAPGIIALSLSLGLVIALVPLKVGVVALIALFILIAAVIVPPVVLGIALLLGPIGATENLLFGYTVLESGQLLFLLAVAGWLARSIIKRKIHIRSTTLIWPLGLFILVAGATLFRAGAFDYGIKEVVKWLELGLAIIMVVDFGYEYGRRRTLYAVLAMVMLSVTVQGVIGIWQFAIQPDGPEHFQILGEYYRASGTFQQPNPFGGFIAIGASVAIGFSVGLLVDVLGHRERLVTQLKSRFLLLLTMALSSVILLAALVASWSRGAWLGFGAGVVAMLLFLPKRMWHGLATIGVAAFMFLLFYQAGLVPQPIIERVATIDDDFRLDDVRGVDINDDNFAVLERLAHWQAAVAMAADNLWTGVGFGNYEPAYGNYALVNWELPLGHAHNYYLNILAETGVPGLIAYLAFWISVVGGSIRLIWSLDWPERGLATGLLAAWITLSAHHLVDKLYVNNVYIYFGVLLGMQQLMLALDD